MIKLIDLIKNLNLASTPGLLSPAIFIRGSEINLLLKEAIIAEEIDDVSAKSKEGFLELCPLWLFSEFKENYQEEILSLPLAELENVFKTFLIRES